MFGQIFDFFFPVVIATALVAYCGIGAFYITALICEKETASLHSMAVADVIVCSAVLLPVLFFVCVHFIQRWSRDMAAGKTFSLCGSVFFLSIVYVFVAVGWIYGYGQGEIFGLTSSLH